MARYKDDGTPHRPPAPGSNPGGRPRILEMRPELEDQILNAVRLGMPIELAGALAGVPYPTIRSWILLGKERPETVHGRFLENLGKAIAEYQARELSVLEAHAAGRPAKFLMEPVLNESGEPYLDAKGNPIMRPVLDKDGKPTMQQSEIKSDWRAAMERLSRRLPKYWAKRDSLSTDDNPDGILTLTNDKPQSKEALSFDERIAQAIDKLEKDV